MKVLLDMDLDLISTQACFLGNWFDSWSTKSLEIQRPFLMDIKKKNEVKYQKYKFFVLADPKFELKNAGTTLRRQILEYFFAG